MHLKEGSTLNNGKYRITRFINSGGFGCTYEAIHTMFDSKVAIKEFFVKDFCNRDENSQVSVGTTSKRGLVDKLLKKFIEEARSIFHMKHPGIVKVTDVFTDNGTAYYVMDYISGMSLQDLVKEKGKLSEETALKYIRQVADALKYVHSLNRIHLDIKPGNVMIDESGNAVLIDFGASKHYDDSTGENTSTLMGVNTPGYAPLEQIRQSFTTFLPAADIYALGATLYKLVTGITPPDAVDLAAGVEKLAPLPAGISATTARAIKESMKRRMERRPQSIDEFLDILNGTAPAATPVAQIDVDDDDDDDDVELVTDDDPTSFTPDTRYDNPSAAPAVAEPVIPTQKKAAKPAKEPKSSKNAKAPTPSKSSDTPVSPKTPDTPKQPEKKSGSGKKLAIVAGVVAFAVTVLVIVLGGKDDSTSDRGLGGGTDSCTVETVEVVEVAASMAQDLKFTNSLGTTFTYTGDVINDVPQGNGTGVYPNGITYEGQYDNGLRSGQGTLKESGGTFTGTFENDKQKEGSYILKDGSSYKGTFDDNEDPYDGGWYNAAGVQESRVVKGVEHPVAK